MASEVQFSITDMITFGGRKQALVRTVLSSAVCEESWFDGAWCGEQDYRQADEG
jgi:hypothetical protein